MKKTAVYISTDRRPTTNDASLIKALGWRVTVRSLQEPALTRRLVAERGRKEGGQKTVTRHLKNQAFRVGSAPDRRLVLSVADVRAPGGALALLAGFRQRKMREQAIGRAAR